MNCKAITPNRIRTQSGLPQVASLQLRDNGIHNDSKAQGV